MRGRLQLATSLTVILTAVCIGPRYVAAADLDSTSGSLTEIAPPASVLEGALEDTNTAVIFKERSQWTLAADLSVDAINPGAAVAGSDNTAVAGVIPAGTTVDSFLVHYDPVGQPTDPNTTVSWSAIFELGDEILGIVTSDGFLDASDFLGAPGTSYPTGLAFRGTTGALEGNDGYNWSQIRVLGGLQSVTVSVDEIRIILAAPIPEPSMLGLFAPALLAMLARGKRIGEERPRAV
jgi:hypothetical protein